MKVALFTWAFIQSFLIGGLLLIKRPNRASRCLAFLFLLFGLKVLGQYLMRLTDARFVLPELIFLADFIDFIEPVLILFYLRLLFDLPLQRADRWYFLPGAAFGVFALTFIVQVPNNLFETYIGSVPHQTVLFLIFGWKCFLLFRVHLLIYGKNKVAVLDYQKRFLRWPKLLAIFLLISTLVVFSVLLYNLFNAHGSSHENIRQILEYNYILFNGSLVLATAYFLLEDPELFKGMVFRAQLIKKDFPGGEFYFKKIEKLLNEDKIYLDSELNEHCFAEALSLQPYLLSKLINQHLGKSFSELINEYRINEAKEILTSKKGKDMTIFAVALDSGFRSESVFYANFKKMTGMTPSQYRKTLVNQ